MAVGGEQKKSGAVSAEKKPRSKRKSSGRTRRDNGMPRLLQTLLEEHRYIDQILRVLDDQAAKIEAGQEVDITLILDVLRYISQAPNQFHHPREDQLFEYLRERDPSLEEHINKSMEEHRHLEQEGQALSELLRQVQVDRNEEKIAQIRHRMTDYIVVLRHHVDGEEANIFGKALDLLSDSEWRQLWKRMPAQDDPLFGAKPDEAFALVSHYLQNRWGRAVSIWAQREYVGIGATVGAVGAIASGAVDVGRIVKDRASQAMASNLKVWRPIWQQRPRELKPYVSATVDTALNTMEALSGGIRDAGEALNRARRKTEEVIESLEVIDEVQSSDPSSN